MLGNQQQNVVQTFYGKVFAKNCCEKRERERERERERDKEKKRERESVKTSIAAM